MKFQGTNEEYFKLKTIRENEEIDVAKETELTLLWFMTDNNKLRIDAVEYTFNKYDIVCLTHFHKVEIIQLGEVKFLRWNKPFYCVANHDSEVGCKGLLFYGAASLPVINLSSQDIETLSTVWKMLEQEMNSQDNLQQEMLQMMLKRILILCARIFKTQENYSSVEHANVDIIREYNFLVEQHFKEKHSVAEYAELLNKSPKTLSNLFKKIGSKSPLQFIHERKILEARRMLSYTDKHVSEISYELGFTEVQAFSRFFKKQEAVSPVEFKKNASMGKIDNSSGKEA
jgi:AraC-like DNA-binding protein